MLLYKWLGNTCVQSGELSEEVDHTSRGGLNSLRELSRELSRELLEELLRGEIVSGRKILVKL
jgi:hypothetical protein